jgi:DNA-binding transcriptional MocR family regulator
LYGHFGKTDELANKQVWAPEIDRAGGPIYLAIADAIGAAIRAGELNEGDQLPTHRALADALGVDLTTITRAYAEARRRGLLQATVGRGTFVRPKTQPQSTRSRRPEDPIDLTMNLPPLPSDLADRIQQGLSDLLAVSDPAELLTYRSGAGTAEERAAGAAWLRPTLGDTDPECVLVCPGAQAALVAVLGALAEPGDVVITEALTYPGIRAAAAQLSIRLAGVPSDAEGLLPDAIDTTCREVQPKALYCIPTIHNPTTVTIPLERRRALAEVVRRNGLRIVEDDAYGLLPSVPLPAIASLAPDISFHVATVSKVLSPALRAAYLVAPDARWAARLCATLRASVLMASPLLTGLLTAWINDGTAAAVTSGIRRESVARQSIGREILPAGSFDAHPEGLHVWLRLPPRWDRRDFVAQLRRQGGLAVVPSDAFAVSADQPSPGAVRISLGAAPSREALRSALRSVAAVLHQEALMPFSEIV